jgi:aspartyl-tRNA(Asn)/glutamyl-tRNA(Gln) amidotransferase subunit A
MGLDYLTIEQAHELLKTGKVTAVELVEFYLKKIHNTNPKVMAVLTIREKQALKKAAKIDKKIQSGEQIGLLEGIPYTAKDMFLTRNTRTTAASKILQDYNPPYTATAIRKLNRAGAVLLAKVNQDEFAHGGSTENSAFHKTHNPWGTDYVPGGSSGGSAAAVAADFGIFSLGTDTGGSIRQPASYCGVTGLKPTYGLVSRYGVVAMASSFDCIGPITRSAEDAQVVLSAIAGRDHRDSTTIESEIYPHIKPVSESVKIGLFSGGAETNSLVTMLDGAGLQHVLSEEAEEIFTDELSLAIYYILVPSEISSNLERYDGVRYGTSPQKATNLFETYTKTRGEYFGLEVKRRNMIGTYALSAGYYEAYYKKALQARTIIIGKFNKLFEKFDLLVGPTTLEPAFKIGAKSDPIAMYKTDLLTVAANLAGLPAISIPCGIDDATGLPLGMQIIGRQGEDEQVLALADSLQKASDWHSKVTELKL